MTNVDDMYPVFANWARQYGLQEASGRFQKVLDSQTLDQYVAEYERRMDEIEQNDPPILSGARESWYPGPAERDRYWPPLAAYLESELGWPPGRVAPVDQASSKVVAHTPPPNGEGWTSKGLVVGYVQSGKTTNFTSVIAKAADVGYKLVIVLSGIHNGLRKQTQQRLDQQLKDLVPRSWLTLTDETKDFYAPSMTSTAMLHGRDQKIALCVVKKNKTVLTRLNRWLRDADRQRVLVDLPTLIIDDEADQASVQTATINPLIRQIIEKLPKCTYIGYTATPFANVLIDPAADDLYPADFILNLPKPEGYFGTERIFGREAVEGEEANGSDLDGFDMVRRIDDDEVDHLRPAGSSAAIRFVPEITESLSSAIVWFWLATAARRARGDHGHSTMLIHSSMKTAVHESFKQPLSDFRDDMLRDLDKQDASVLVRLEKLWNEETARVPAGAFGLEPVPFETVLDELVPVVTQTKIILDNCRSSDRLDYSNPSQTAIAVGGNTLSRGLTLEGLVVSHFVRSAGAYDTLLQMARWFGFRPNYEDLPRIWMTDQLKDWFRHLATVEHEIRLDIDRYEQQGLTPVEFGVRIKTHPVLRVTAKMGAWKPDYASYSGRRIQTRYFKEADKGWLDANLDAADELITDIRAAGGRPEMLEVGGHLFRNVRAELVEQFLGRYRSHEDSPDLDGALILKYIAKQREIGDLDRWSVAVMAGASHSTRQTKLGGIAFNQIERSKLIGTGPERADIKTLMSKDHRVVDIVRITPAEARKMNESALVDARNGDPVVKTEGLLLLYPIDPLSRPNEANSSSRSSLDASQDVIGMALVFPGNAELRSGVKATHISVDLTNARTELDADEQAALEGSVEE